METATREPTQEKRVVGYKLTESAIEAVQIEARKRRCWPNRVIEDLIRKGLVESGDSPESESA